MATLLLLQTRGRVTAAEIAEELEVSVATARRDLEALLMAGIPVYPQVGRGGGWALIGGARTDLSGLTAGEAQALFTLAGPATAADPDVRSALRKLVQALPDTFRADAQAAAASVVIDSSRWGDRDRAKPPLVDVLQGAVIARRRVRLTYLDRSRTRTERVVDPWGLVGKDDIWYLIAGTDRGQRTFRVDRIADATVTEDEAERPDDFERAEAWAGVVEEVEQQRSIVWATVLVAAEHVRVLRDRFGRQCEVGGTAPDGRVEVRVSAPAAVMVAQELAGWGGAIELVDSPEVRAEMVRIAAELVARYPPASGGTSDDRSS